MSELTIKTLGESGEKILVLAKEFQDSINAQWNDEAIQRIQKNGEDIIRKASDMKLTTPVEYEEAKNLFLTIGQYVKAGEQYTKPFKDLAHKPHKLICDMEKMFRDPSLEAKNIISKKITDWRDLERRREAEERRKAEYERQKEEDRKRKAEEAKAEKAIEKGNEAKAEMHMENAESAYVPPPVQESKVKKTESAAKGTIPFVQDWKVEIKSEMTIVQAVAAGKLPLTFLDVNEGAVKKWAKVCGIKNYEEHGLYILEFERPIGRGNFNA